MIGGVAYAAIGAVFYANAAMAQIESTTLDPPAETGTRGPARIALPPPRGQRGVTLLPNGAVPRDGDQILPNGQGPRDAVSILEPLPGEEGGDALLEEDDPDTAEIFPLPGADAPDLLDEFNDDTISLLPDEDLPQPGTETPTGNLERFKVAPFRTPEFPEQD
ncbi:MAG: hypothetical protein AAFT19_02860, partial [Pseudomonadota bacterium]